jgi:hypothetical protein
VKVAVVKYMPVRVVVKVGVLIARVPPVKAYVKDVWSRV